MSSSSYDAGFLRLERAGKIEPATLVDHIVALEDGGELLPAIDGLMSMCISCHNMKHAGGIRGCDVDGMPLNPSHPWFVR